jgi:hypothetical protein
MISTPSKPQIAQSTQGELFGNFDSVADSIGKRIAEGILGRIQSFPEREALLGRQAGRMVSLPEGILWEGLGEESAPVFVVYKLIHEAFSNARFGNSWVTRQPAASFLTTYLARSCHPTRP